MIKKIFVLTVVLLMAAVSVNAYAFRGQGGRGTDSGYGYGFNDRVIADLNLTAEQTEQISALRLAHLKEIQPTRNSLNSKRSELRLLWLEKTPDQQKIMAVNQEFRALRDQLQDKMTSHRLAIRKVLTPEQQAKFQTYGLGRGYGSGKGMRGQGGMGMDAGMGRGMGMRGY